MDKSNINAYKIILEIFQKYVFVYVVTDMCMQVPVPLGTKRLNSPGATLTRGLNCRALNTKLVFCTREVSEYS